MVDVEQIRTYCLAKKAVTESFPFDADTLVFKVAGKMFALFSLEAQPLRINLKCAPEIALELRDQYNGLVLPGYHMNKNHWNTIVVMSPLKPKYLFQWIDDSYDLVAQSLTKKQRLLLRGDAE
ncbi:MAG: MmcQ-like protein [Cryomorphaceae bacterium BACL21 MAG-121220-bin10]|jgi:predicted DNA-binding protein (MmcQ/YjbR family)|nr:MAG: MmcQ-like protein [Cryomorphaceae bacterium BACL21 MAG-121220-bin10]MDA0701327.1 MmcQ/YjbR family DNA-binding protein [Bacteroidota bacterium]|tara:strand:- start:53367 stop:53735 length:369 start_codon:yes stop_codon:yes gene_type:complete